MKVEVTSRLERVRARLNPLLTKEAKERVRSPRAVVILAIYLVIMSFVMYTTYFFGRESIAYSLGARFTQFAAPILGRNIFEVLVIALLVLVALIGPAIAAGSIVSEREKRTFQLVQITLMRPLSIALGKVWASLAFLFLLILVTAPLFTIPLVLGGVGITEVLRGLVVITSVAALLCCVGVYFSSVARKGQFAVIAASGLTMLYFFGTLIVWGFEINSVGGLSQRPVSSYLNPIVATASAVATPSNASDSPLGGLAAALAPTGPVIGVWVFHVLGCFALSALLLWLTTMRIRTPVIKFWIGKEPP